MRGAARFTAPRLINNRDRDAVLGREAARVAGVRGCTLGGSSLAEQGYARRDGDDMVFVPCDVACSASARARVHPRCVRRGGVARPPSSVAAR